jgi:Asp-tRNA(Asn)/Glu-tRNA(Gln) amidotransferase A subunit family amidase
MSATALSAFGPSLLAAEANAQATALPYHSLGVAAAAAAIRRGEISAEAYAGALLGRARQNAGLNAFITIDDTAVLAAARAADKARAQGGDAPLLGVPLAVKDSYMTRGLRTSFGTGLLKDYVPDADAAVVAALKSSGAIVFGKNNLVEMCYGLTGSNAHHGQPRNPYDMNRVTGGSSSGAGASVAARLVPAALGGDTVGSIRVPASFCGVVGFKPTPGRWSGDGVAPISHTLDTTGVLARSVEDCALIDGIVTGAKRDDRPGDAGLKGVRLAIAPKQFQDFLDPGVAEIFQEALGRLRHAGADIIEVDLGEEFAVLARKVTWSLFFHETMPDVTQFLQSNNIPATFEAIYDQLTPEIKESWSKSVLLTGDGYVPDAAIRSVRSADRTKLQSLYAAAFTRADALVLPTTRCAAPEIAKQTRFPVAGEDQAAPFLSRNTFPASGAGLPAITVPMGLSVEKLPVGLEIEAAAGGDRSLLSMAARIEMAIGSIPAPGGFG